MYNLAGFNWEKNSQKISSSHGQKHKGEHIDLKIKPSYNTYSDILIQT